MMPALQMSTSSRLCVLWKARAKPLTESSEARSSSLTSTSCTLSKAPCVFDEVIAYAPDNTSKVVEI